MLYPPSGDYPRRPPTTPGKKVGADKADKAPPSPPEVPPKGGEPEVHLLGESTRGGDSPGDLRLREALLRLYIVRSEREDLLEVRLRLPNRDHSSYLDRGSLERYVGGLQCLKTQIRQI